MDQYMAIIVIALAPIIYVLWEGYGIFLDTRPNKMRAVFINEARQITTVRVTLADDEKTFRTKGKTSSAKYHVQEACIYRLGTWRVPTSYYVVGQADPIDIREASSNSTLSAADFEEATEAAVARQILKSFDESVITITSSMMIVIIVIAIANGLVYMQLKTEIGVIKDALGVVAP